MKFAFKPPPVHSYIFNPILGTYKNTNYTILFLKIKIQSGKKTTNYVIDIQLSFIISLYLCFQYILPHLLLSLLAITITLTNRALHRLTFYRKILKQVNFHQSVLYTYGNGNNIYI